MDWFVVTSASPRRRVGYHFRLRLCQKEPPGVQNTEAPFSIRGCKESPQPALGTIVADAFSGTVRPRGRFAFFREHEQGLSDTPWGSGGEPYPSVKLSEPKTKEVT